MLRRRTARPRALTLLALALALPCTLVSREADDGFVVAPFLQHMTRDAAVVVWESALPGEGRVEWGTDDTLGGVVTGTAGRRIHEIRLTGLPPGAPVFYRAATESGGLTIRGPLGSFRLPAAAGEPLTFAVVGDTQDRPEVWERVAAAIARDRPDFLLHVGDLVGDGHDKSAWTEDFFRPARRLLSRVPMFAVPGNHEDDAGWYYDYLAAPEPEHRYVVRWGDATIVMVDTNRPAGPGSEQWDWLEERLAAADTPWLFVVHHHPVWTSDRDDYGDAERGPTLQGDPRARPLAELYERYGVDVVFYGHVHAYERTWPLREGRYEEDGVVYVQTGGGGGRLDEAATLRSSFTAKLAVEHHHVMVSLRGSTLEIRAQDPEGRLIDRWTRIRDRPAAKAPRR